MFIIWLEGGFSFEMRSCSLESESLGRPGPSASLRLLGGAPPAVIASSSGILVIAVLLAAAAAAAEPPRIGGG